MKILFDFQDMSGGAPRSQLAHMQVMKGTGYDVVATIGKDCEDLRKKAGMVKVIPVQNFTVRRPIQSLLNIFDWLKVLHRECPDIIQSNRSNQFKFLAILSDFSGIPLVFVQAGGEVKFYHIKPMAGKIAIVYSLENKTSFLQAGFKPADVHVITNRIPSSRALPNCQANTDTKLKILVSGNIKKETIKGLTAFLDLIENNAAVVERPLTITIAGSDVTENRIYINTITEKIQNIKKKLQQGAAVEYAGWVEDIETLQASSDICIGKGRSVIQPAMCGKICFVLAETGVLTRVNPLNFNVLYKFNFSGRGNPPDDTGQFLEFLKNGFGSHHEKEACRVSSRIKEVYLQDFARFSLEKVYHDAINRNTPSDKWIRAKNSATRFIRIYWNLLRFWKEVRSNGIA